MSQSHLFLFTIFSSNHAHLYAQSYVRILELENESLVKKSIEFNRNQFNYTEHSRIFFIENYKILHILELSAKIP